jgi:hypothetical protein
MTLDEWREDAQAQKKTWIFFGAAAVAVSWLLLPVPSLRDGFAGARHMFSRKQQTVAAQRQVLRPYFPPPAPQGAITAPPVLPVNAAFLGHWTGGASIDKQGLCGLQMEIHQGEAGKLIGYPEMSCLPSAWLTGHGGFDIRKDNPGTVMLKANPTSAIISGLAVNGSVQFHVDKITNTNSAGCVMSSLTATVFGAHQLAVQWVDSCGGGNMMCEHR